MRWLVSLSCIVVLVGAAAPARAGDFGPCYDTDDWCRRDAIYERFRLIADLEANPDVDDAIKGPLITAARREIHRLRAAIIAPPPRRWTNIASPLYEPHTPCCYSRPPIHIR